MSAPHFLDRLRAKMASHAVAEHELAAAEGGSIVGGQIKSAAQIVDHRLQHFRPIPLAYVNGGAALQIRRVRRRLRNSGHSGFDSLNMRDHKAAQRVELTVLERLSLLKLDETGLDAGGHSRISESSSSRDANPEEPGRAPSK